MGKRPSEKTPGTPSTPDDPQPSAAIARAEAGLTAVGNSENGNSATDPKSYLRLIESQVRDAHGRVWFSHTTWEEAADEQAARLKRRRSVRLAAALVTFLAALSMILAKAHLIAQAATALTAFLSFWASTLKEDTRKVARARKAAIKLWALREKYHSLVVDFDAGVLSPEEAKRRRDDLQKETEKIYGAYPQNDHVDAFKKAGERIKAGQTKFSKDELDTFVAPALRKGEDA